MAVARYLTKRNAQTAQTALMTALQAVPQNPTLAARTTLTVAAAVTRKAIRVAAVGQNPAQTIKDLVCNVST